MRSVDEKDRSAGGDRIMTDARTQLRAICRTYRGRASWTATCSLSRALPSLHTLFQGHHD